jgi:hypothetical protein
MSISPKSPNEYFQMDESQLWGELGKAIKEERMGILPEDEDRNISEAAAGFSFFKRQLNNIKKIFCADAIVQQFTNEQRRDIAFFVATVIDTISAYYGKVSGTIILVQLYKIGIDRFCSLSIDEISEVLETKDDE